MGESSLTEPNLASLPEGGADAQTSKKRKVARKTLVTVRIETSGDGRQKGEGPPSDSWSWRKYGQKPIKGSPYPRGYYRCSTSKGCSAKKQVERCRTDPSVLIITYTSEHNHADPDHRSPSTASIPLGGVPTSEEYCDPTADSAKEPTEVPAHASSADEDRDGEDGTQSQQSPPERWEDDITGELATTATADNADCQLPPSTLSEEGMENSSSVEPAKSAEDDIFDELGELPVCSSFTGWVRSSSWSITTDERVFLPLPIPLLDNHRY